MKIRPYKKEDEAEVIALWQACDLVVPWNDPQKDIARKLTEQSEMFLVGESESAIVATVMAGYDGHRTWVNYLAVAPSEQRKHYGQQMMAAVEKIAEAKGCPKVNLQVRGKNQKVIEFYQAIGYELDDCVSLGKRLIPDA